MTQTIEERLSSAMHAVVPDLVPPPMLADRARSTARRSRRLAAVGVAGTMVVVAGGGRRSCLAVRAEVPGCRRPAPGVGEVRPLDSRRSARAAR